MSPEQFALLPPQQQQSIRQLQQQLGLPVL
jgi:hypothetical protein